MSFNIGLSGFYAANKQLDVTGNNIANVATTGFKSSRAEFSDIYAASKLGTGQNSVGSGVNLAAVSQQWHSSRLVLWSYRQSLQHGLISNMRLDRTDRQAKQMNRLQR